METPQDADRCALQGACGERGTAPAGHASHDRGPDGDHSSPHPHRPRAAYRHPRKAGLDRRRGFPDPRHCRRDRLPEPVPGSRLALDVVISCSISKFRDGLNQWLEPTMSGAIAEAIGATNAMTFDLTNACAGMLSGVMVLNNWIRQGSVERGLVVSGEYISQLGKNAARHVHGIMSRELASLTLGDAGRGIAAGACPCRRERHPRGGLHDRGRSQPPLPRLSHGRRPRGAHVHPVASDPEGRHRRHTPAAARSARLGRPRYERHRLGHHPPDIRSGDHEGHGRYHRCAGGNPATTR